MNWILVALFAYFLVGLEVILDKFLLTSKKVSHPAVYAFYSGLLSSFALVLIPFGVKFIPLGLAAKYIFFGFIFVYGILCLFFAINKSEASRVIPVVGAIVPIVTYLISHFFSLEYLKAHQILGIVILVSGGLLISFDLPIRLNKKKFFLGFFPSVLAGILLGVSLAGLKHFYVQEGAFINVFMWSRLGLVIGAISLLVNPDWRKIIFHSSGNFKNPKKENIKTGLLFVVNKGLGGAGSILTNYAVALGSVTIVSAMVSVEYVFIFLMSLVFSVRFPRIFQEEGSFWDVVQKIAAILIIAAGLILVSIKKI